MKTITIYSEFHGQFPIFQRSNILRFFLFFNFTFFSYFNLSAKEDTLHNKYFGKVNILYEKQPFKDVVLFLSGKEGFADETNIIAKSFVNENNLVIYINFKNYLKEEKSRKQKCFYPPGDLEMLSKYIQKKYDLKTYISPVIAGLNEGGILAYSSLLQSPENTFMAAISINFSPEIMLEKPLCKLFGLNYNIKKTNIYELLPRSKMTKQWFVVQCNSIYNSDKIKSFVKQTKKGEIIQFQETDKGFYNSPTWNSTIDNVFDKINIKNIPLPKIGNSEIDDLPLTEIKSDKTNSNILSVMVSGDGGWSGLDVGVSKLLSNEGISVIGLNTLKYFWNKKTPEQTSKDLKNILLFYLDKWKKEKILLIGYSFGAEVLPFMINGLPDNLKSRIELVVLIGPTKNAEFEFHFTSWLNITTENEYPVLPQIQKFKDFKTLCIYSKENNDEDLCCCLDKSKNKVIPFEGGHHFDNKYKLLANEILKALK